MVSTILPYATLVSIPPEIYDKFSSRIVAQIQEIETKFSFSEIAISNLNNDLKKAVDFTQNVNKYWGSGDLDQKRRIQKLVFPDELVIDTEKRQNRTSKVNTLFSVKRSLSNEKKDSPSILMRSPS